MDRETERERETIVDEVLCHLVSGVVYTVLASRKTPVGRHETEYKSPPIATWIANIAQCGCYRTHPPERLVKTKRSSTKCPHGLCVACSAESERRSPARKVRRGSDFLLAQEMKVEKKKTTNTRYASGSNRMSATKCPCVWS